MTDERMQKLAEKMAAKTGVPLSAALLHFGKVQAEGRFANTLHISQLDAKTCLQQMFRDDLETAGVY